MTVNCLGFWGFFKGLIIDAKFNFFPHYTVFSTVLKHLLLSLSSKRRHENLKLSLFVPDYMSFQGIL